MKYILMLLTFVFLLSPTFAEEKASLQPTMQQILLHIQALMPYAVDKEKFEDPGNEKAIKNHLSQLTTLMKKAKHNHTLKSPALSISRQVLEDHLREMESVFNQGNKNYARWAFNSTLPICMSCHTQFPTGSTSWNLMASLGPGKEFEHAELLFTARNFDSALTEYDQIIDGFPGNKMKIDQVQTAIERKVAIFSRIKRDFKSGIKSMQKSAQNEKLPESIQNNIQAWEAIFRAQVDKKLPDPKVSTDKQIREYVEGELKKGLWDKMVPASNPRLVTNLTVSGILYEYLNLHPKSAMKPDILYWLSLCDRALNNNFFYSLADLYLKECMNQFSSHPIAKKCYTEYENHVIASYSGSKGTDVPLDATKELELFKEKVFKAGKK